MDHRNANQIGRTRRIRHYHLQEKEEDVADRMDVREVAERLETTSSYLKRAIRAGLLPPADLHSLGHYAVWGFSEAWLIHAAAEKARRPSILPPRRSRIVGLVV